MSLSHRIFVWKLWATHLVSEMLEKYVFDDPQFDRIALDMKS